ncbi:MAG: HAMP domain-containing sensor histidine kinase [Kyrpidia sp.]|nr:HAMP domain-containing sensor histidine kinase [Kyrpidia sp.]
MVRFQSLRSRLTMLFLAVAAGSALVTSLIVLIEAHYHFRLYERQVETGGYAEHALNVHLEQALQQSVAWTAVGMVVLAAAVSFFAAKRIAGPLAEMTRSAERMTAGELDVRTAVVGRDEVAGLGRALNQLAEALSRQEASRKTMTADIAHELRTPLATLKSHIEAFLDGVWEPDSARLRSCYEEIERLTRLVRDVEELAKLEAPDFRLQPEEVDLCGVAARAVDLYRPGYVQKGVELFFECGGPVRVTADGERLIQVMANLLSNALKATPPGGRVTVSVGSDAGRGVIRIQDTGKGIPPEEISKVFERFYRLEKGRSNGEGSGIGLTIVQRLVEAHGGRVWMDSEPEGGTTVRVELPARRSSWDLHKSPVP